MAASVDRSAVTPFLLRVFVGNRFAKAEFEEGKQLPSSELHLYTWHDATLRELAELIKGVDEAARERDQDLFFSLVMWRAGDSRPRIRPVGHTRSKSFRGDEALTLGQTPFEIGDMLLVEKSKQWRE